MEIADTILKELGLQARRKSQRKATTNSAHGYPRYPNLVEYLTVSRPDQVWVCDVRHVGMYEIPVKHREG